MPSAIHLRIVESCRCTSLFWGGGTSMKEVLGKYIDCRRICSCRIFHPREGTVAQTCRALSPAQSLIPAALRFQMRPSQSPIPVPTFYNPRRPANDGSYRSRSCHRVYVVSVKAANFSELRASGIVVQASQVIPYSARLELAKGSQVIEVTEQTPLCRQLRPSCLFRLTGHRLKRRAG